MKSKILWLYGTLFLIVLAVIIYNVVILHKIETKITSINNQLISSNYLESNKNNLLVSKNDLESKRTIQLSILIGCIGLTSLLLAAFNVVFKYSRSFGYYLCDPREEKDNRTSGDKKDEESEASITQETTELKCLTLINYRDKTETVVSVFFKGGYKTKVEIHSINDEPCTLAAFGHVSMHFDFRELTRYVNYENNFTLHAVTGDGGIYKCKSVHLDK